MELEPFLSATLRENLAQIKQAVSQSLDQGQNSFIDYSTRHSERVIELLKSLLERLMQRQPTDSSYDLQPLNKHEIFILLSAAYLHHVGILQFGDTPVLLTQAELNSHTLILKSVRDPQCPFKFNIPERYVDEIAALVQGLAVDDISSPTYTSIFIDINKNLRVRLLSALLKLADGLDLTHQSIDDQKLLNSDVDLATKSQWAKLYCVQGLGIRQGKIEIHFRFPPNRFEQYQAVIPRLVFKDIEKASANLTDILWNYEIYVNLPTNLKNHKCIKRPIDEFPVEIWQALEDLVAGRPVAGLEQSQRQQREPSPKKYDVVISYASTHREIAAQLAQKLEQANLSVFFDRNQLKNIAASDLADELQQIYRDEANLCILMTSEHYLQSPFTRQEYQAVLERTRNDPEYLILVNLDEVPASQEFPPDVACLDWKDYGVAGIFEHVIARVKQGRVVPGQTQESVAVTHVADEKTRKPDRSVNIIPGSILIVTVTKVEAIAVRKMFSAAAGKDWVRKPVGNKTYYDLGFHGGVPVFMVQSEMGTATPGGALLTVHQAIADLKPQAVIMCGIAFGLRPNKQHLGDILISKQLTYYEPQKVDLHKGQIPRGDRATASERLLDRFRSADFDWKGAQTHFGLVFSGEKLINDPAFRDYLLKVEPEAVGGEMEGAGLYAAARDTKVDWILVKAICDWADGNKDDQAQLIAAENAATFVLHVLQLRGWND